MDRLTELINEHLKTREISYENPPWIIKKSSLSGRGLFASRNIQPGEVIFKDNPLIIGPRAALICPTICVSCFAKSDLHPCSRECGLPVCSEKCENSDSHIRECQIISRWKNGHDFSELKLYLFKCLTPVRSLFLSDEQKVLLRCLKSHSGPQHGFEVDILKEKLMLHLDEDEEELMRLTCSILDANSFEVIVGNEDSHSSLRGLYPLSSLMNHECIPNTMHNFDCKQNMIVKATVFIPEGREIFHSYTRLIWGTSARRAHLARTKHFFCTCTRCNDPTEFGTNLSAINCVNCEGLVLPVFLKNGNMIWRCTSCNEVMPQQKAGTIITVLGSRLNSFDSSDVEGILEFLKGKLLKYVPATSQISLELKYKLVWILGYNPKYLWKDLSDDLVNEKENICRELLELLKTLGAGQSKMRGLLLYELYCCLRERQRRIRLQKSIEKQGENLTEDDRDKRDNMASMFHEARIILMDDVHSPAEIRAYNAKYGDAIVENGFTITNGNS